MANNGSCDLSIFPYAEPLQMQSAEDNGHSSNTKSGQFSLDSCERFMPKGGSSACNACGCHRALHPNSAPTRPRGRVPVLLPLLANLERGDAFVSSPMMNHRPIRQSRILRQPTRVVTRKVRTKITRAQEDYMEFVTNALGWHPRKQDKTEVDRLCQDMGITKGYYLNWIRDMKLLRDSEREAVRMRAEAETATETETDDAVESLLMLYCSS